MDATEYSNSYPLFFYWNFDWINIFDSVTNSVNIGIRFFKTTDNMTEEDYIQLGRNTAKDSLFIGTGILFAFILFNWSLLIVVGLIYIFIAFVVNIVVLVSILIKAISTATHRRKLLQTAGLMLLNIPVAISFVPIAIFGRVTFRHLLNSI